jgi:hypothetical protein
MAMKIESIEIYRVTVPLWQTFGTALGNDASAE